MTDTARETRKQIFVVLNPVAGHLHTGTMHAALRRHFGLDNWSYEIYETTGKEDICPLIREACRGGAAFVIAAGGDGTVASVANALVGTGIPLGILPFGTGNMLARALGIPQELEPALRLLSEEHYLQTLDVMQVGERYFLINVSAGISASTMRDTESRLKRRFGMAAYIWTVLKKLPRLRRKRFRVVVDGQMLDFRANEVLITNGALLNEPPFFLGSRRSFNDGYMDVFILTADSMSDHLKLAWSLLTRPRHATPGLERLTAREHIEIETPDKPQPVQADGETIGQTPVVVRVVPSAIQVIAPPQKH